MVFYSFFIFFLGAITVPILFKPAAPPRSADFTVAESASFSVLAPTNEAGTETVVLTVSGDQDFILAVYEESNDREMVISFFEEITGSHELASVILSNAASFNIPAAMAFSLCYEESQYNPKAVNRTNRNQTIDRGLFQLNSASFPDLAEDDFFNPETNAYYGMAYLRFCLDTAGTEVSGLAMYNAGANRVRADGTPKTTLDYISRIMKRQRQIDELFLIEYAKLPLELALEHHSRVFSLNLLSPLGKS